MKKTLNFFSILGVVALCFKYYFSDKISGGVATFFIVGSVILLALDKPIWHFLKAGIAIFSFGLLMVGYTYNMNDFMSLLQPILTMLIVLFGIYLMVRKFFGNNSSNDDEEHFIYDKKTGKLRKKDSWW